MNCEERRALTLRFLATGESFRSLHFKFRISRPAISYIVTEVCDAVPKKLGPSYLKVPSSEQERLQIAKQFEEKWKFPNCLGAIDGNILLNKNKTFARRSRGFIISVHFYPVLDKSAT